MSNELRTTFIFDDAAANQRIDLTEKRLVSLDSKLNNFGRNPTFGSGLISQLDALTKKVNQFDSNLQKVKTPNLKTAGDDGLRKAAADILQFEKNRAAISKSSNTEIASGEKALTRIKISEARTANNAAIDEIRKRERAEKQSQSNRRSAVGGEVLGGLGLSLGIGAGVAVGVKFLKDSTEAAFDAERANRKLSASATEAGLAYGVLADKNREFAKSAGLSETAATNVTAKIAQLATFSGKPENIERLQQSFLDLSAAKGIAPKDVDVLIGTILSGQDEGLNRLGISDPGQLYKAYAKEIGKTADQLSQFEKVQAATNAVMDKAAIFTGANSDKMASLSGQSEKASANLENLYTNFGQGLTQSLEFRNFLGFANSALESLTTNLANVKKELGDGASPRNLAVKEGNKPINQTFDAIGDFASLFTATGAGLYDFATGVPTEEIDAKFKASIFNTHQLRIKALTENFTAEQKLVESQKKDAAEQKEQLGAKTFATSFQSKIDSLVKSGSDGVGKIKIQAKDIADARRELNANLGKLNDTELEKAQTGLTQATRKFYSERADAAEKRFSRNPSLAVANFDLQALNGIKSSLPEEQFESFSDKLTDFVKNESKKLLELKNDFRDTFASAKSTDNPIVKTLSDIETATERAQLKFGAFGSEVVKNIAAIETANLNKALNLQKSENNFAGLKFDQEAIKLAATPERSFADFARKLELVNRKVEFVSGGNDLNRKIAEADFFAKQFNPSNPKSFNEFNRRGPNDDISDAGVQIRNAVSDIQDLKNISLDGTGLDGKEAVINKILDSIPPRGELLKRLNSPNLRGESQSLLEEQANALRVKKDLERNKFNNFIEDQKTAEFGKVFAREQIGLINSSALTDPEKAKQRLAVTDALGNDLDPGLKRQRIQDFVASANEKRSQENEALQISKDVKAAVEAIAAALEGKGIKIDIPAPQVNVTLNGVEAQVSQNQLPPTATSADTSKAYSGGTFYDDYQNR